MFVTTYISQMLCQLNIEEEIDDRRHSLNHSLLERELEEDGMKDKERLTTAQTNLATAQAKQNCLDTLREMESRRHEAEIGEMAQVEKIATPSFYIE